MLNVNETIDFGGTFTIRARLTDPFNCGQYVDWTDAVFSFVVFDFDANAVVDVLTAVQGGVNDAWWTISDSPGQPNTVFSLDVPKGVTATQTFTNAKYTVWVLYPSGFEYALLGGALVPGSAVPVPP